MNIEEIIRSLPYYLKKKKFLKKLRKKWKHIEPILKESADLVSKCPVRKTKKSIHRMEKICEVYGIEYYYDSDWLVDALDKQAMKLMFAIGISDQEALAVMRAYIEILIKNF